MRIPITPWRPRHPVADLFPRMRPQVPVPDPEPDLPFPPAPVPAGESAPQPVPIPTPMPARMPVVPLPLYPLSRHARQGVARIRHTLGRTETPPWRRVWAWRILQWRVDKLRRTLASSWPQQDLPPRLQQFTFAAPSLPVARYRWGEALRTWMWRANCGG